MNTVEEKNTGVTTAAARPKSKETIVWKQARVKGTPGYLFMRNRAVCSDKNEIALITNGTAIKVNVKKHRKGFIWAQFYGLEGWVNRDYVEIL